MEYAFRSHKDTEFGWWAWLRARFEAAKKVRREPMRWVAFR